MSLGHHWPRYDQSKSAKNVCFCTLDHKIWVNELLKALNEMIIFHDDRPTTVKHSHQDMEMF